VEYVRNDDFALELEASSTSEDFVVAFCSSSFQYMPQRFVVEELLRFSFSAGFGFYDSFSRKKMWLLSFCSLSLVCVERFTLHLASSFFSLLSV
jgi:hypothetical protein